MSINTPINQSRTADSFVTNGSALIAHLISSICTDTVVSSRFPSLISSFLSKILSFKIYFEEKKTADCDRVRGLDIAEHSLRDVFNDVSKYIGNISISLNSVFP